MGRYDDRPDDYDDDPEAPDEDDQTAHDEEEETLLCPRCGAAIWEESEQCPRCGEYVTLRQGGRVPGWMIVVGVVVIALVLLLVTRYGAG